MILGPAVLNNSCVHECHSITSRKSGIPPLLIGGKTHRKKAFRPTKKKILQTLRGKKFQHPTVVIKNSLIIGH